MGCTVNSAKRKNKFKCLETRRLYTRVGRQHNLRGVPAHIVGGMAAATDNGDIHDVLLADDSLPRLSGGRRQAAQEAQGSSPGADRKRHKKNQYHQEQDRVTLVDCVSKITSLTETIAGERSEIVAAVGAATAAAQAIQQALQFMVTQQQQQQRNGAPTANSGITHSGQFVEPGAAVGTPQYVQSDITGARSHPDTPFISAEIPGSQVPANSQSQAQQIGAEVARVLFDTAQTMAKPEMSQELPDDVKKHLLNTSRKF